jgi:hypothetical protein
LPAHWSWIDHRLVRDHHLSRCSCPAWTLYLFLVTVGDAQGLSYYSEPAICRCLDCSASSLREARQELIQGDLVAYEKPLYQVLDLSPPDPGSRGPRVGACLSLGELLRRAVDQPDQGGRDD